ncbi:MAG: triose-phosphate isomerase [Bacteroidota bacterium]|nr:triose-phosphate isomerase [Bacteroidota bacterium]
MRKKIIAANWKMNLNREEAENLMKDFRDRIELEKFGSDVLLLPPAIYLQNFGRQLRDYNLMLGAQDISAREKGAFTGEISAGMLSSIDVNYTLVGHSERRSYHKEDHSILMQKVDLALENNLKVIYACGETLEEKESGRAEKVVSEQISDVLFHLSPEKFREITIAYEPVWAIGTGKTATPKDANIMHQKIRKTLQSKIDSMAKEVRIIYGGSVTSANAKDLFDESDIDGALVGGASLRYHDFIQIIRAAEKI